MKRDRDGNGMIGLGVVLIAAAFLLSGYNLMENRQAGEESARQMPQLEEVIQQCRQESVSPLDVPDYQINPDIEMPTQEIDGIAYIGILEIPVLELKLPVAAELTYLHLRKAPCCYAGSVYQDNMVVAAHNYQTHFGNIKNMKPGDMVQFTDMDGNVFSYQVVEQEILQPTDVEEMKTGDWDLTLFTCTLSGAERVTVRLEKAADTWDK